MADFGTMNQRDASGGRRPRLAKILMGSDVYETEIERSQNSAAGQPDIGIGAGSHIVGSIIDKNCRIGERVVIENSDEVAEKDWPQLCYIRDGIMVIPKNTIVPDGWRG